MATMPSARAQQLEEVVVAELEVEAVGLGVEG